MNVTVGGNDSLETAFQVRTEDGGYCSTFHGSVMIAVIALSHFWPRVKMGKGMGKKRLNSSPKAVTGQRYPCPA